MGGDLGRVPPAPVILFFTYRVSLALWAERGILGRETELYHRILPHVGDVAFVTYGTDDAVHASRVAPIRLLPRPRALGTAAMSVLAPLVYRRDIRRAAVLKTNQASGAWTAVLASRLFGKPLVVRCGYPWSFNYARESPRAWRRLLVLLLERLAVRAADRVIVTTAEAGDYLARRHGLDQRRLRVVPNHVDLDRFAPDPAAKKSRGLVAYVGRLSPEKNLGALVDAVAQVEGARLLVVGDGPERDALARRAAAAGAAVELAGTLPNEALPHRLAEAEVFALPSLYEGQPKALLEAMACGVAVLGADVPGIRDVIRHGDTGWLARPDATGLADGLRTLLGDAALRARLGERARAEVAARWSLDAVAARELEVLGEVTQRR
jgi:glycosyltransferase involved in cell wall biosynthesis